MPKKKDSRVLRAMETRKNAHSGVREFDFCVIETDSDGVEVHGPHVTMSIDHYALENSHGGSHQRWVEEYVKPHMMQRHQKIRQQDEEAEKLVGKNL